MAAESLPLLRRFLLNDDEGCREEAFEVIRRIGAGALPLLTELLSWEESAIRRQAVSVLIDLAPDTETAQPALISRLERLGPAGGARCGPCIGCVRRTGQSVGATSGEGAFARGSDRPSLRRGGVGVHRPGCGRSGARSGEKPFAIRIPVCAGPRVRRWRPSARPAAPSVPRADGGPEGRVSLRTHLRGRRAREHRIEDGGGSCGAESGRTRSGDAYRGGMGAASNHRRDARPGFSIFRARQRNPCGPESGSLIGADGRHVAGGCRRQRPSAGRLEHQNRPEYRLERCPWVTRRLAAP